MPTFSHGVGGGLRELVLLVAAGLFLPVAGSAQATAQAPPDSALALVDELRTDGDFRRALSRLGALRDQFGDDVSLLWRMAITQTNRAKTVDDEQVVESLHRGALQCASQALAVDSLSARAHYAKAVAEGRMALNAGTRERVERSRAVKKHADRAIELDSTLAEAYHTRARWNREVADLGFLERAVVKTIYGGLPDASNEQAVRDFRRAIALQDRRFHRLELAKTYFKMDREEEAHEELRPLLELAPRGPFDKKYGYQAQQLLNNVD